MQGDGKSGRIGRGDVPMHDGVQECFLPNLPGQGRGVGCSRQEELEVQKLQEERKQGVPEQLQVVLSGFH